MGCCGSKKKIEDAVSDDEPATKTPSVEEEEPEEEEVEKPEEEVIQDFEFSEEPEKSAESGLSRPDESLHDATNSIVELDKEEECTHLEPTIGRGELEPIEPVKIPFTSHVDSLGPGDKNHIVVSREIATSVMQAPSPSQVEKSHSFFKDKSNLSPSGGVSGERGLTPEGDTSSTTREGETSATPSGDLTPGGKGGEKSSSEYYGTTTKTSLAPPEKKKAASKSKSSEKNKSSSEYYYSGTTGSTTEEGTTTATTPGDNLKPKAKS